MINGVSRGGAALERQWNFGAIRWTRVLRYQDWVNLLLTIGFVVGLLVADSAQATYVRPYWIYDATISFPYNADSTIPYWVAVVVPLVLMLISFLVGELLLAQHWHGTISSAVASVVFFTFDGISAFIVTGFTTQITKEAVGRYRPDWLARCQPAGDGANAPVAFGRGASANPACNPVVSDGELKDGHWSFPSGHSSTVFVFAVYGAAYCLWAFYHRVKQQPPQRIYGTATPIFSGAGASPGYGPGGASAGKAGGGGTWAARWLRDLVGLAGFVFILVQMAFAWGVAASRIVDNKHHPSDIISGAVLGGAIALLYLIRAVPRHRRLDELDDGDGEGEAGPTPLLAGEGQSLPSDRV
ncbi:hypothetical protein N2152v2_000589 [Parachlorella kessleri]